MNPPSRHRRVLFVDHVSRILGGAEVNLVELLGESTHPGDEARQVPTPSTPDSADPRRTWDVTVACDPAGRLHEALGSTGVIREPFSFAPSLGTLRVVGRRFPLAGALRGWRALAQARNSLSRILATVRPDVVVSCTNKDHFAAGPACRKAGIPSIWWVNDILSADFFPWTARRAFRFQADRGASKLVVVSEFARRVLLAQGLPEAKVAVIHNGIPLSRYAPQSGRLLRKILNLPDDEPLVGILGRFTPWKGQRLFLELAEAWCRENVRGQFALVGHAFNEDQAYEHELREFIRQRGLRDRIHFIPFQKNVAAVLGDLDVLIHASLKPEPFGRVIIEGMAVGVPVIAARDGGVPEIVTDGVDGLLARPGALGDYLARLKRLLEDGTLRARLRVHGRETVLRRFSVDRVRAEFDHLFASPR